MIKINGNEIEMEGTGVDILTEFGCIVAEVRNSMVRNGIAPKEATGVLQIVFDKSIEVSEEDDKPRHEEKVKVIHVGSMDEAAKIIAEILGGKR